MSNYTKTTNFTTKDGLTSGNPLKVIKGSYFDTEFDNIATAITSKYDTGNLASEAQAQAGTNNTTLMTPLRTENWSATWAAENGGIVANLQALADPGADSFLVWDNSATDAVAMALLAESALAIDATPALAVNISALTNEFTVASAIAGADLLLFDNGAGGVNTKIAYQDFGIPVVDDTTQTPLSGVDLTFANRWYSCSNAAAITAVIPANASVAFPIGTVLYFYQVAAGQITVSVTSDTLRAPNGAKTSQQYSVVCATKVAATTWVISGDASA